MPDDDLPDPVRAVALAAAAQALADLARLGAVPRPCQETVAAGGWEVRVAVGPSAPGAGLDLTPCERDVLTVLGAAGAERWVTSRVIVELDRRGMAHGEATVKRALSRLHKAGHVGSSRKAPSGYWLLSLLPLFQRAV